MRILFDQGTPAPLRRFLRRHTVQTASELGWSNLSNGDLLAAAQEQFDALITTDQNLSYQQDVSSRTIAIIVLTTTRWRLIERAALEIEAKVDGVRRGDFLVIEVPKDPS